MPESMIDRLRSVSPKDRASVIQRQYDHNYTFFSKHVPHLAKVLDEKPNPYDITVTDNFLEIVHTPSQTLCHPEAGLDKFSEALGDWTHQSWIDFVDPRKRTPRKPGKDKQAVETIHSGLLAQFPVLEQRLREQQLELPRTADSLRFSPPVVFVGLFHGLHIAHYLSRTHVHHAAFIEPEPERFALTCAFLDFKALTKRFNGLNLAVGQEYPINEVLGFFHRSKVLSWLWTRVLPGYASEKIQPIVQQLRLQWLSQFESFVPLETEIQGMVNGLNNVKRERPILAQKPHLSKESKIAVVGSGPSLQNDLEWLKANQERLIIFSVHSAVRHLQANDIRPDFQFSLDIQWDAGRRKNLQLDPDVPLVLSYKADEAFFHDFICPLLIVDSSQRVPFRTKLEHPNMYPTTGNLALAFACWCSPQTIYLLGLDFGFRSKQATHVQGGQFENNAKLQEAHAGEEQIQVQANFPKSSVVYSRPYFNEARMRAEQAIAQLEGNIAIYNLSDGARIAGAEPAHSPDIQLKENPQKHEDISLIRKSFQPAEEGKHWNPEPSSGEKLLSSLQQQCTDSLHMERFSWPELARRCDELVNSLAVMVTGTQHGPNRRLEPFLYFVHRALAAWLKPMLLASSPTEAESVYSAGYGLFTSTINQLTWPPGLAP